MQLFRFFRKHKPAVPPPSYPQLTEVVSVTSELDEALTQINSSLRCVPEEVVMQLATPIAIVSYGNRFVQVYIEAGKNTYLHEFWHNGVYVAQGYFDVLAPVAQAINYWLKADIDVDDLIHEYPFITPYDNSDEAAAVKEVEKRWSAYCSDGQVPELQAFLRLAAEDEVVSKLSPYTSLYTLCFSRCTEYPFDNICMPFVIPKAYENYAHPLDKRKVAPMGAQPDEGEVFVVTINRYQYVGEGNAATALQLVKSLLPPGIRPIRRKYDDL
ncbi:hypothetical protein HNQ91_001352 [Filimonas zeae]|uniref:Uncharacterized protein n=1 Tax=Filimonas zeae TaxID=1737353 RepID=A0A917ISX5_9BACT|nr:DUF6193 family natural product biosynthesis protein [Filimonas zeae]MDR6338330.1 hypothetical protein [Filimonas zeae]GGH62874.1 hypothetical protein GCM10011379_13240 [Filimonas zeae]